MAQPFETSDSLARGVEIGAARRAFGLGGSMLWWRLASIVLFCIAWEIAGQIPINLAFPPFSATMIAFFGLVADGSLPSAYLDTLQPLAIGIVISGVFGVVLGIGMGLRGGLEWFAAPVFIVMQAAPMAALIPLVTFVYGIGLVSKVIAVIILAMPVIVLNSYKAVHNVSPSLIAMCRVFQGSRLQEIMKIVVPDASPMIFAGLRLGIAAGFIGVVLAELLITPTGIGDLITYYQSVAEYAKMYAVIASIIVFAALTVGLLQQVEVRWLRPEKRTGNR